MRINSKQSGFSAVELLITLFIAAVFLITGFQLYVVIIKNGGEARKLASASSVVTDYMQRYKSDTTRPCTAQTPLPDSVPSPMPDGLSNVTISVTITCPYTLATSVSKIIVTIKYGNPQQTIIDATYTKPEDGDIVTNGLVLNLDAGNKASIKDRTSIINWNSWTIGAGGTSDYSANGDGNSRVIDTNPWGASDIVWDVSNQDAASDADGGWIGSSFPIDNTKMYRFTTWVRRKTIGSNGSFYLGTAGGGALVLNRSNGVENNNPYFSYRTWWGPVNQWYLVVGYIWPAGSGAGSATSESGIYDLSGTKLYSNSDFVWQPTTTTSIHRSYLYYSTDVTTNQQWYQPRVDIVNGAQPTITELLNNAGNTWYDLSGGGNNGTLLNGVGYTTANGEALSFDGVDDYVSVPNITLDNRNATAEVWLKHPGTLVASQSYGAIMIGTQTGIMTGAIGGSLIANTWNTTWTLARNVYTPNINDSHYHQVTMTLDSNYINLYCDGNYIGHADTVTGFVMPNIGTLIQLGRRSGAPWNGSIAAARIYNRALSATEVKQNYNALRGRYGL